MCSGHTPTHWGGGGGRWSRCWDTNPVPTSSSSVGGWNIQSSDYNSFNMSELFIFSYLTICSTHFWCGRAFRIQWPNGHVQWFSDSGHQIITKLQCNLQNGQRIFKYIALWQVKFENILEPLSDYISIRNIFITKRLNGSSMGIDLKANVTSGWYTSGRYFHH